MPDKPDAHAWLRAPARTRARPGCEQVQRPVVQAQARGGRTNTMARPGVYQNVLMAVMHAHAATGFKDPSDPCNSHFKRRSDMRRGAAPVCATSRSRSLVPPASTLAATDAAAAVRQRRRSSSYSQHYASMDHRPIQFREDGLPISARRVPGRPLMVRARAPGPLPALPRPSYALCRLRRHACVRQGSRTPVPPVPAGRGARPRRHRSCRARQNAPPAPT